MLSLLVVIAALTVAACGGTGTSVSPASSASAEASASLERLQSQNDALKEALLNELASSAATRDRLSPSALDALSTPTAAEAQLARRPRVARLVRDYFETLLHGRAPGKVAEQAREKLVGFFTPQAASIARVRYLELGKLAASHAAPWPAGMLTRSLAVVHSIFVNRAGDRATVVVCPVHEFWAYVDSKARVHTGEFDMQSGDAWNATSSEGPHRLTLVRRAGTWLIGDDFTIGNNGFDVATTMKDGGAPKAIWQAVARRIVTRTTHPIPVPAGVKATFERFLTLLNEHRYRETDALFIGGHGYGAFMFARPYGHWHYALKRIGGFDPLSEIAVASYPDIPFVVVATGPTYETGG
ncbi:MAG TPA: hypothetical protein VIK32_04105, partial [Candidatus Limnocylindrales bacterium]